MSLDATHLKSRHKGTIYLATVKTGLNEIYTVAISIQRNECYEGWKMFLTHLKDACLLLDMDRPQESCSVHCYYTFASYKDKVLVQALKENFKKNQSKQCSIHIQKNVH
jgi:MULE transposase domain